MAEALGHTADADFFRRRSGFWRNVFDTSCGFARGKDSRGNWREPFNPADIGFGPFADNDFCHHIPYVYALTDRPWRTAEVVREILATQYAPRPDGLCGNDDCGQMSAWYIFAVLGFYPVDPCGGEYVIGAPQVPRVEVEVEKRGGQRKIFSVIARGFSKESKYVKSVTLNGKPITDWKIRHADIMKGGELVFEMSARHRKRDDKIGAW